MDGRLVFLLVIIIVIIILVAVAVSNNNSSTATTDNDPVTQNASEQITDETTIFEPELDIETVTAPTKIKLGKHNWKIPKCIYQTQEFSCVPMNMKIRMDGIISMNSDFGYKYYDDFQARNFLVKHMDEKVVQAYDLLIPGAYKADLFRYCLLYIKGGVYLDSSFEAITPLNHCLHPEDLFVAPLDSPSVNKEGNRQAIYNAFMASVPRHPILEAVINLVVDRIHQRDKGTETLYLTGPLALGLIFMYRYQKTTLDVGEYETGVRLIDHQPGRVMCKDEIIFKTKYPEYGDDMKKYHTHLHYGDLWNQDLVFKDKPTHIPPGFNYNPHCPNNIGWPRKKFPDVPISHRKTVDMPKYISAAKVGPEQKIPYLIHQTNTYSYIPIGMYEAMQSIIRMNPEYTHKYYDLEDTRNYIQQHLGDRGVRCFDALIPGAYKADFFRYTVIYMEGGVYMDSGSQAVTSLSKLVSSTDEFIAPIDNGSTNISCAFFAARPQHPILKRTLELMMTRIENREYGPNDLYITGPVLFREAFSSVTKLPIKPGTYSDHIKLIRYDIKDECNSGQISDDHIYVYNKYPSYRLDVTWYNPVANYAHLWQQKQIYTSN